MVNFTLEDLMQFTQKEEEMVNEILYKEEIQEMEPGDSSVRNLIAYNKALSVRKSERINQFRIVLN